MGAWANLKTDDETACPRSLRTWRTPIYAIVRSGGKQYRVEPDQTLDVDLIKADVGSTVDFGVLLVGGNGEVSIGTPEVDKAKVVAEIIEHGRGTHSAKVSALREAGATVVESFSDLPQTTLDVLTKLQMAAS